MAEPNGNSVQAERSGSQERVVSASKMKRVLSDPPGGDARPRELRDRAESGELTPGTSSSENFCVVLRVRPALERELAVPTFQNVVSVGDKNRQVTLSEVVAVAESSPSASGARSHAGNAEALETSGANGVQAVGQPPPAALGKQRDGFMVVTNHVFTFDHVYGPESAQVEVYETSARGPVQFALQGYNATILAYGQTGAGKTHTMEGFVALNRTATTGASVDERRGIIPRSMDEIFQHIQECADPRARFLVRASYLQIYNEALSDLLSPELRAPHNGTPGHPRPSDLVCL
jgi:hypothetical protein